MASQKHFCTKSAVELLILKINWVCFFLQKAETHSLPAAMLEIFIKDVKKGQCHEIFEPFFEEKKTRPGPHLNRQKREGRN